MLQRVLLTHTVLGTEQVLLSLSHENKSLHETIPSAHIPDSVIVMNKHLQSTLVEHAEAFAWQATDGQQPQLGTSVLLTV